MKEVYINVKSIFDVKCLDYVQGNLIYMIDTRIKDFFDCVKRHFVYFDERNLYQCKIKF